MVKTMANRDIPAFVRYAPAIDVQGYGALSYTPNGYWTGHMPRLTTLLISALRARQPYIPMIYSYGTPIAWYDRQNSVWVKPDVSYSVTTGKHQSHLWALSPVTIPYDCGIEEYERYVTRQMTYSRWDGIKPGPNYQPEGVKPIVYHEPIGTDPGEELYEN